MNATDPTLPGDAASVVRTYVSAVEAGDEHAVRELFAADATWTLAAGNLPISGTWAGREAILTEFLGTALSYYEPGSVQLEITGMTTEHDRVVLQWISRARTRDGRPYQNECIGVFTVRDGKIQTVREYMDTLYAHDTAFGASPDPLPSEVHAMLIEPSRVTNTGTTGTAQDESLV